jgi:hypothetical protein
MDGICKEGLVSNSQKTKGFIVGKKSEGFFKICEKTQ